MKFADEDKIPDSPYPRLKEVLRKYSEYILDELQANLVGIYLAGSLASGDFDLDSDVDFLVLTKVGITEANIGSIQKIQEKIREMDCYPAIHLEGSFCTIDDLSNWTDVGEKPWYYFDNGSTTMERSTHDNKWHVRWILRERGLTLLGPAPDKLLKPVPRKKLMDEITAEMANITSLFRSEMDKPLCFWNSRFGQAFTVLTCCRMLHTLDTGTVQSKKAGMLWAADHLDDTWLPLIEQAWIEREGVRFGGKISQSASGKSLQETMKFLDYTLSLT